MTLFTAEGLIEAEQRFFDKGIGPIYVPMVARAYLDWLFTQGIDHPLQREASEGLLDKPELFSSRAPGHTCISALRSMRSLGGFAENDSKGCGGIMRVAPVGLFFARKLRVVNSENVSHVFAMGADIARITHGHPTGFLSAGFFAALIFLLILETELAAAICISSEELAKHPDHEETLNAVDNAVLQAQSELPGRDVILSGRLGEGWVAEESLAIALYCALKADDFRSGVLLSVNHGGDSDSTGSITGNILGVIKGDRSVPRGFLRALELRHVLGGNGEMLAQVLGSNTLMGNRHPSLLD